MASGKTENYGLSQWEATDQVVRADFNADNAKIDAEIKATQETANVALETARELSGIAYTSENAPFVVGSYRGTDTYGNSKPTIINVGFPTWCVILSAYNNTNGATDQSYVLMRGMEKFLAVNSEIGIQNPVYLTWTDTGVELRCSLNASYQQNYSPNTYHYIAFR